MPGDHSREVIPVPIPNTEVKLSYADDTAEKWESRKLPGFFLSICLYINRNGFAVKHCGTDGKVCFYANFKNVHKYMSNAG